MILFLSADKGQPFSSRVYADQVFFPQVLHFFFSFLCGQLPISPPKSLFPPSGQGPAQAFFGQFQDQGLAGGLFFGACGPPPPPVLTTSSLLVKSFFLQACGTVPTVVVFSPPS